MTIPPGTELLHSYYVVFLDRPLGSVMELFYSGSVVCQGQSTGMNVEQSQGPQCFNARSLSASESRAQTFPAATEYRRKSKVVTSATPRLADVREISSASA